MYPLRAQKPSQISSNSNPNFSIKSGRIDIESSSRDQTVLSNAFQIRGSRPRVDKLLPTPYSSKLEKDLPSLKSPPSLELPNEPSQVKIQELRPLTLEDVEILVEKNNPNLKASAAAVDQAKSLLIGTIASWYPNVSLSANGLPNYLSSDQFTYTKSAGKSYTSSRQWTAAFSAQVKWNLIDPARVPAIAAARDTYEKTKYSYVIALRDLRLKAVSQYFELQRADEGVRIGKDSMRASVVSLKDAESRFKAGVATKLEVLEAETQLARDKQLLTSNLGKQKITRRVLSSLLGLPHKVTPTAASSAKIIGLWMPSLQESIVAAYAFREELDNLILDISIINSNANKALASIQPTLSISNTFSATKYQGEALFPSSESVDMREHGWTASNTIGLNATWNIFDGGRAKANYNYNKYKVKQKEADFASTRDAIRTEVENSFFSLQTANQDILTTSREVLASRESLRLARLRYQAGITTQREVVNNQRDLTRAEVRHADAISSYNINLSRLRRRTGLDKIAPCQRFENSDLKRSKDDKIQPPIDPLILKPACNITKSSDKS